MSQTVNINNLRSYLTNVVANQIRSTQPAYTNQFSLVNAVTSTSSIMNINNKTGTIKIIGPTGTIIIPQPVINPILVNTPTSFISTTNNQVSVTSKGSEDRIIISSAINISDIEFLSTDPGYTKNNSIINLYDNISTNYWNPQTYLELPFSIGQTSIDPYGLSLKYKFNVNSDEKIYKLVIKNNNSFPGFYSISIYSSSNFITLYPYTDINDSYINENFFLLIDDNGVPLFDVEDLTVIFNFTPYKIKNQQYQMGGAYGVIYNDTIKLRSGDYFFINTSGEGGSNSRNEWTIKNQLSNSTNTGTVTNNNNFIASIDGQYQIVWNGESLQDSNDYGETFSYRTINPPTLIKQNYSVSKMTITDNGQYRYLFLPRIPGSNVTNSRSYITSDNYGLYYYYIVNSDQGYTVENQPDNISCASDFSITNAATYIKYIYLLNNTDVDIPINYIYYPTNVKSSFNINHTGYPYPLYKQTLELFVDTNANNLYIVNVFAYDIDYYNKYNIIIPKLYSSYGYSYFFNKSIVDSNFTQSIAPFAPSGSNNLVCFGQNKNSITPNLDGKYKTGVTKNSSSILNIYYSSDYGNSYNLKAVNLQIKQQLYIGINYYCINIRESKICISPNGQYQIIYLNMTWDKYPNEKYSPYVDDNRIIYSQNYGQNWTYSNTTLLLNRITNISYTTNFNLISINGGLYYELNGIYRTDPINYVSSSYGITWVQSSSINPFTQLTSTIFYTAKIQTNKTYFQIKDLNQTQVLGVSDNGFKMTKDLRVTNANGYVIGGNMTIGPDEASSLLNDYSLNVDGIISCRNIVTLSDERFKNITGDISNNDSYDIISKLKIIKYTYTDKNKDDKEHTGLIAQEVHKILPDAVDIKKSKYLKNDDVMIIPDIYSIDYNVLLSHLISAFQLSQKEINLLKEEINKLKQI